MPRGTQRKLETPERVETLERQVAELTRKLNSLTQKPRTAPAGVTLARTIDDGSYPSGYYGRYPIVFLDPAWNSVTSKVNLTPRSEERQTYALCRKPLDLPVGVDVYVRPQRNGGWLIVGGFSKFYGKATGGIAAGGSGTVTIYQRQDDGTWDPMLDADENPLTVTADHPPEDAIDIAADAWLQCEIEDASGRWIADAGYCEEEA